MAEVDALLSGMMWKVGLLLLLAVVAFIYKIFRPGNNSFFRDLSNRANAFLVHIHMDYFFCRLKLYNEVKTSLFSAMGNRPLNIVEIGIGTGTNFEWYPEGSKVTGIEPNVYFEPYMRKNQKKSSKKIEAEFTSGFGENMESIDENSMDAVVISEVLCSVNNVGDVLKEAKRVLKKDGVIYLLQHDAGEKGTWMYTLQKLFDPMQKCCFNCDVFVDLSPLYQMGFAEVNVQKVNINSIAFVGMPHIIPHSFGTCKK